mmetsp:Transcript_20307/g.51993  ORF Transcript_20307/g.51993 Transcript_20307/m.51993 type:complete len:401 (-) Transcript_20307:204-1406(-)
MPFSTITFVAFASATTVVSTPARTRACTRPRSGSTYTVGPPSIASPIERTTTITLRRPPSILAMFDSTFFFSALCCKKSPHRAFASGVTASREKAAVSSFNMEGDSSPPDSGVLLDCKHSSAMIGGAGNRLSVVFAASSRTTSHASPRKKAEELHIFAAIVLPFPLFCLAFSCRTAFVTPSFLVCFSRAPTSSTAAGAVRTASTSPIATARAWLIASPFTVIIRASKKPTTCGRRDSPFKAGRRPSFTSGRPILCFSPCPPFTHMRNVQARASSRPPPKQSPLMRARVGKGRDSSCDMMSFPFFTASVHCSSLTNMYSIFMSAPAMNPTSLPDTMTPNSTPVHCFAFAIKSFNSSPSECVSTFSRSPFTSITIRRQWSSTTMPVTLSLSNTARTLLPAHI